MTALSVASTSGAAAVIAAGVAAAFNAGKLPPAMTVLRGEFGISLVEASFLVSVLQLAAVMLGIVGGMLADRFGQKRVMCAGLFLSIGASAAGTLVPTANGLLASRFIESLAFMLTVLPGPSLVRRCAPGHQGRWIGSWAGYMPFGMAFALLVTPQLIDFAGWRLAWWWSAGFSALVLAAVLHWVPTDPLRSAGDLQVIRLLGATVGAPGPWLLALGFGCYAAQWMGVFSFLPTIYHDAGVGAGLAGVLTASAVAINVVGTVAGGALAGRRVPAPWLVVCAALAMASMSWLAFGSGIGFAGRFIAICVFSMIGGLIPGALFALSSVVAPSPMAVSTTVGLMQQGSAAGQVISPPILASAASAAGTWTSTWKVTASFAVGDLVVAALLFWVLRQRPRVRRETRASSARPR